MSEVVRTGMKARSIIFPHLTETHDFVAKKVTHSCEHCGGEDTISYQYSSMELDCVAKSFSFLDRHKHDEWPEIIE